MKDLHDGLSRSAKFALAGVAIASTVYAWRQAARRWRRDFGRNIFRGQSKEVVD